MVEKVPVALVCLSPFEERFVVLKARAMKENQSLFGLHSSSLISYTEIAQGTVRK